MHTNAIYHLYVEYCEDHRRFISKETGEVYVDGETLATALQFKQPKKILKKLPKKAIKKIWFGKKKKKKNYNCKFLWI